MGAPSPPSTSEITSAANTGFGTQTGANTAAQYGSQYNQYNPYGNIKYVQTGVGPNGAPQYSAVEHLSQPQQALLNQYTGTQNLAGAQGQSLLASANYGGQSPTQAIGDMSSGLTSQMMGSWLKGTTPFFTTQQDQLDTKLRNMGIQPGNKAYDVAMRDLTTNQGLAVSQAAAQFQPQAFQEATGLYQMPLTMSEKLSQWGAPTTPNASFTQNTPAVQPADYAAMLGATIPAYMQPYQAQYQQYGNMMSGLFGLGNAGVLGLAMSDMRLKENIAQVAVLPNGIGIYRYNFIGSSVPQIGVMAQEVQKLRPDCVVELPNSYLAVNYGKLLKGH